MVAAVQVCALNPGIAVLGCGCRSSIIVHPPKSSIRVEDDVIVEVGQGDPASNILSHLFISLCSRF